MLAHSRLREPQVLDEVTLADVLSGSLPEHVRALADQPDAWRNR